MSVTSVNGYGPLNAGSSSSSNSILINTINTVADLNMFTNVQNNIFELRVSLYVVGELQKCVKKYSLENRLHLISGLQHAEEILSAFRQAYPDLPKVVGHILSDLQEYVKQKRAYPVF